MRSGDEYFKKELGLFVYRGGRVGAVVVVAGILVAVGVFCFVLFHFFPPTIVL